MFDQWPVTTISVLVGGNSSFWGNLWWYSTWWLKKVCNVVKIIVISRPYYYQKKLYFHKKSLRFSPFELYITQTFNLLKFSKIPNNLKLFNNYQFTLFG